MERSFNLYGTAPAAAPSPGFATWSTAQRAGGSTAEDETAFASPRFQRPSALGAGPTPGAQAHTASYLQSHLLPGTGTTPSGSFTTRTPRRGSDYGIPTERSFSDRAGEAFSSPFTRTTPFGAKRPANLTGSQSSDYTSLGFATVAPEKPPVDSLYDLTNTATHAKYDSTAATTEDTGAGVAPVPIEEQSGSYLIPTPTPLSPTQREMLLSESRNENDLDERWVTVFGFPPSAIPFVRSNFEKYGEIIEQTVDGGQCNWVHFKYATKLQAQQALSKNGKIIGGVYMVGVLPCIAPVAQKRGETSTEAPRFSTPRQTPYHPAARELDVQPPNPADVIKKPPKDTLWAKCKNYIFGL